MSSEQSGQTRFCYQVPITEAINYKSEHQENLIKMTSTPICIMYCVSFLAVAAWTSYRAYLKNEFRDNEAERKNEIELKKLELQIPTEEPRVRRISS
jgi:hypothetical protein